MLIRMLSKMLEHFRAFLSYCKFFVFLNDIKINYLTRYELSLNTEK